MNTRIKRCFSELQKCKVEIGEDPSDEPVKSESGSTVTVALHNRQVVSDYSTVVRCFAARRTHVISAQGGFSLKYMSNDELFTLICRIYSIVSGIRTEVCVRGDRL